MNIDKAITESIIVFVGCHDRVNRAAKIVGASLTCAARLADGSGGSRILESLIAASESKWGKNHNYDGALELIAGTRIEVGRAFIARVFSALESYFQDLSSLLTKEGKDAIEVVLSLDANRESGLSVPGADDKNPVSRFLVRHKFSYTPPLDVQRTLQFFWAVRNSIIHADSRVGPALLKYIEEDGMLECIVSCAPKMEKEIKEFFAQTKCSRVVSVGLLFPILLSGICLGIVKKIDAEAVSRIGKEGIARMAFRLIENDIYAGGRIVSGRPKSFHRAMTYLLATRFRVQSVEDGAITSILGDGPEVVAAKTRHQIACNAHLKERDALRKLRRAKRSN